MIRPPKRDLALDDYVVVCLVVGAVAFVAGLYVGAL